jgi:hypothetical protein
MSAAAAGRTDGALVLACLDLDPDPARVARVRAAAAGVTDWAAALAALEAHGVIGLAARNLTRAGVELPDGVARRLAARASVMQALELAADFTLERFLRAAGARGIEVTLLKGASLALDLYPPGGLRAQQDLDLLVAEHDLAAAVDAGRALGLGPPRGAFPSWWYRLAHFHRKLAACDGLQREIELHWHLHAPAQLYTVRLEDLRARRVAVRVAGLPAFTLDPLDRLLHLATHLARHAPLAGATPARVLEWAGTPRAPLRMKWVLDLVSELERRAPRLAPTSLAERAREWNAEEDLARVLALLAGLEGLRGDLTAWLDAARGALPAAPLGREAGAWRGSERPRTGLDVRVSALRNFPRWVWPPDPRCARLAPPGGTRVLWRARHAAGVLGQAALVGALTPLAWLLRTPDHAGATVFDGPEEHARVQRILALAHGPAAADAPGSDP